ncbi:hypothetical protein GQ457_13G024390 [Hibiscus cannabinus]
MSGVWVFKKGVVSLVDDPSSLPSSDSKIVDSKVLVHTCSDEVITSHEIFKSKLSSLGWEKYYGDSELIQFHKKDFVDSISLPKNFNEFKTSNMYDVIIRNCNEFEVRDM